MNTENNNAELVLTEDHRDLADNAPDSLDRVVNQMVNMTLGETLANVMDNLQWTATENQYMGTCGKEGMPNMEDAPHVVFQHIAYVAITARFQGLAGVMGNQHCRYILDKARNIRAEYMEAAGMTPYDIKEADTETYTFDKTCILRADWEGECLSEDDTVPEVWLYCSLYRAWDILTQPQPTGE